MLILVVFTLVLFTVEDDLGKPRIMNVGHRGDSVHGPENTMESFELAHKYGGDGFETDLRLTKDGVIVLRHDEELSVRSNCTGSVHNYTLKEIRHCDAGSWFYRQPHFVNVPLFEEAVEFASENDMLIVMDLKLEGLGAKIAPIVKKYNMEGRVIASCWTNTQIEDINKYLNITIKQKLQGFPSHYDDDWFVDLRRRGVHALSVSTSGSSMPTEFIHLAHFHQMPVFAWTITDMPTVDHLGYVGADGIIGNDVLRIEEYLVKLHDLQFTNSPAPSNRSKLNYEDSSRNSPVVIGANGESSHAPENTIAAFLMAKHHGADGVSIDVQLTVDHVPVVIKDDTLDRTTNCTGLVSARTLEYLKKNCDAGSWYSQEYAGELIPTLMETIELAHSHDIYLIINIRDAKMIGYVAHQILNVAAMRYRVILSVNDMSMAAEVRKNLPNTTIDLKVYAIPLKTDDDYFNAFLAAKIYSLSFENCAKELTNEYVKSAHKRNILINAGVHEDPDSIFDSMKFGSDVIMAKNSKELGAVVKRIRERAWP